MSSGVVNAVIGVGLTTIARGLLGLRGIISAVAGSV